MEYRNTQEDLLKLAFHALTQQTENQQQYI